MVPKKRLLSIINPISGTHSKIKVPDRIGAVIDKSLYDIEIVFTEYAGHATLLAQKAADDKIDCVLSVGGDGTCNEVAKGLIHSDTVLGIVPMGSGNGLARHLDIPIEIDGALKVINEGRIELLDYCKANDKLFFCTCGVGFDAWISQKFAEDKRRGGITYLKNVVTEYLKYKTETYLIESESGSIQEKAFLIACGNASQYGNNAYIAPHASMQDGKIDVTIIRPFTPFDIGPLAVQLFTKVLDRNINIRTFATASLSITREHPGIMHLDGEPVEMGKRIDISCVHDGLKAIIPKRGSGRKSPIEPLHSALWEIIDTIKSELNI
ncbi:diacylglycerol/lipid kinase family protein [Coprobacter tertius]|uniref:diacylglycerol/lipid kinase family protein n=1 Tax=Coprobacter tertius TaxID=2944915 RepID=UPI0020CDD7B7|nr:YegS/Rv2252/BmrU family lipid kinase [Coprobacter tertius]